MLRGCAVYNPWMLSTQLQLDVHKAQNSRISHITIPYGVQQAWMGLGAQNTVWSNRLKRPPLSRVLNQRYVYVMYRPANKPLLAV
jgi:hypothetical protein